MNISSLNYKIAASYGAYSQKLTQKTKEQLEKYGIPYNNSMSEEEGKKLIKNYEANQAHNQSSNSNNSDSLLKRARELAKRLGIPFDENTPLDQLLVRIERVLNEKIQANENNIDELKKLKGFSQELAFIQAQSNGSAGYENTNQALMTSLELLSEYNKNFIKNH